MLTIGCAAMAQVPQLPERAVVYRSAIAQFQGEPSPLKVIFYSVPLESVGVIVSRLDGSVVAATSQESDGVSFRPVEETGVYDVTGDGSPEIVLVGQVGAKTLEAKIYRFINGKLEKILEWSGWSFRVVRPRGKPVIAVTPTETGSLTEFYVWDESQFRRVSGDRFPEFYAPEIKQQRHLLNAPGNLPFRTIVQACELGARALIYGKKYEEAQQHCEKALDVARKNPRLTSHSASASPDELQAARREAEQAIRRVLEDIAQAKKKGAALLPEYAPF